jgi:NAD(P)-dependent dehydrogenase (short-subunit alcohol dehydrogenase family)
MPEDVDTSIAGQVAFVTGGARGLGAATPQSLRAAGARVFVLDLHHPDPGELFDDQIPPCSEM